MLFIWRYSVCRVHPGADPEISFGGHDAPKAPRSCAAGARIEAPQAPRGVGCGEWVSRSPPGEGLGRVLCPLPIIFLFNIAL